LSIFETTRAAMRYVKEDSAKCSAFYSDFALVPSVVVF
jgi:hypothetical protein